MSFQFLSSIRLPSLIIRPRCRPQTDNRNIKFETHPDVFLLLPLLSILQHQILLRSLLWPEEWEWAVSSCFKIRDNKIMGKKSYKVTHLQNWNGKIIMKKNIYNINKDGTYNNCTIRDPHWKVHFELLGFRNIGEYNIYKSCVT